MISLKVGPSGMDVLLFKFSLKPKQQTGGTGRPYYAEIQTTSSVCSCWFWTGGICLNASIYTGRHFCVTFSWAAQIFKAASRALQQGRRRGGSWLLLATLGWWDTNPAPLLWVRPAWAFLLFLPPFSQPVCLPAQSFHIQNKAACNHSCSCRPCDTCPPQCQPFPFSPRGGLLRSRAP